MSYRTIDSSCLPMRCPLVATIAFFLLLDRLDAPGWLWGVVGSVMACVWVAWIAAQVLNDSQPISGFGEIPNNEKRRRKERP